MITVKLNGTKYQIPSTWREVKTRQYIRILKEWEPEKDIADRDYFKLLNILADVDFAFNDQSRDIDNQLSLVSALGWVVTEPFKFDTELPKAMQIGNVSVTIPKDPKELSIGQNIHLRRFLESRKDMLMEEGIPMAISIYLQPTLDNKLFHIEQAQHYAKKIAEMPVSLTYPLGFFLLKQHSKFGQRPVKTWPLLKISLKETLRNLWHGWQKSKDSTGLTILK